MKTENSNIVKRFFQYQKERFHFLQNGLFLTAFAFSAISYSRICRGAEGFVELPSFLVAAISTILFFFLLRIIDEFKDREEDAKYRPHLPVPRGLISLQELKYIGYLSFIILVLINAIFKPGMLPWLLVPIFFLLLIANDFFVSNWLKKNWLLYVLSHMFFYPAIDMYSSGMDWFLEGSGKAPQGMFFFFIVSYFNGIVYEVGRKIKADENEEHNSYTTMYGPKRAVWIWIGIISTAYLFAILASSYVGYGWLGFLLMSLIFASSLIYGILFLRKPSVKLSKLIELASGSWGLFMYLVLGALPMILKLL